MLRRGAIAPGNGVEGGARHFSSRASWLRTTVVGRIADEHRTTEASRSVSTSSV